MSKRISPDIKHEPPQLMGRPPRVPRPKGSAGMTAKKKAPAIVSLTPEMAAFQLARRDTPAPVPQTTGNLFSYSQLEAPRMTVTPRPSIVSRLLGTAPRIFVVFLIALSLAFGAHFGEWYQGAIMAGVILLIALMFGLFDAKPGEGFK